MIVVIGSPIHRPGAGGRARAVTGLAARIATAAVDAGADVQLIGRVGDDPAGDATLLALADRRVGHVAVLRDAGRATRLEPAAQTRDDAPSSKAIDPAESAEGDGGSLEAATLDAGDLDLALRYLVGFAVLVVAEDLAPDTLAVAVDAAGYAGSAMIVLLEPGRITTDLPSGTFVLEAPPDDPDGVFARTVGVLAAELDRGVAPGAALESATIAGGWERAAD